MNAWNDTGADRCLERPFPSRGFCGRIPTPPPERCVCAAACGGALVLPRKRSVPIPQQPETWGRCRDALGFCRPFGTWTYAAASPKVETLVFTHIFSCARSAWLI